MKIRRKSFKKYGYEYEWAAADSMDALLPVVEALAACGFVVTLEPFRDGAGWYLLAERVAVEDVLAQS